MKILLLGSSGMLGRLIYKNLKNDFKIYVNGLKKKKYDLSKKKNLLILLTKTRPDIVINSSGLTNIDICEKNKRLAKRDNVEILKNLFNAKKILKLNFWLIQISTDHMYDSTSSTTSSLENSRSKINNYYTKSKLDAEQICRKNKSLILRTNFFGKSITNKKSFSDWIFRNLKSRKPFFLFNDVYFSPLRFKTFCDTLKKLVKLNFGKSGVYNLGSNYGLSKLEFYLLFSRYLKLKNNKYRITQINNIIKTKRSKNMLMNVEKFENTFKIKLPNLNDEIKNEIKANYRN